MRKMSKIVKSLLSLLMVLALVSTSVLPARAAAVDPIDEVNQVIDVDVEEEIEEENSEVVEEVPAVAETVEVGEELVADADPEDGGSGNSWYGGYEVYVNYNLPGHSNFTAQYYHDGDTYNWTKVYHLTPGVTKVDGWTFEGYKNSATGLLVDPIGTYNFGKGLTLNCSWFGPQISVKYDPNGGAFAEGTEGLDEDGIIAKTVYTSKTMLESEWPAPTRTGYQFNGWYASKSEGNRLDDNPTFYFKETDKNKTYYAHWTANIYNVVFNYNYPTPENGKPIIQTGVEPQVYNYPCTYDKETTLAKLKCGVEKYKFAGWNTKADGSGVAIADGGKFKNLTTEYNDSVTIYGQWTYDSQEITITFDPNGGHIDSVESGVTLDAETGLATIAAETGDLFGRGIADPPTAERYGFVFLGWSDSPTKKGKITSGYSVPWKEDVTLYASWEPCIATLVFDANYPENSEDHSGEMNPDYNAKSGVAKSVTKNKFKVGRYVFDHWNTKANDSGISYADGGKVVPIPDESITEYPNAMKLYAQWVPASYSVVYNANAPEGSKSSGNMKATTRKYFDDTTATLPNTGFKVTGYVFTGWSTTKDGTTTYIYGNSYDLSVLDDLAYSTANTGRDKVTLYAQWKPIDYVICLESNAPAGFTANNGSLKQGETSNLLDDIFSSEERAALVSSTGYAQAMCYGEALPLLGDEYKIEGYYITGWNTQADGKGKKYTGESLLNLVKEAAPGEVPVVKLYAQWALKKYVITYNLEKDAKLPTNAVKTYDINTPAFHLVEPTRKGYTFMGYRSDLDKDGVLEFILAQDLIGNAETGGTILGDLTVIADWDPLVKTVTIDLNDGNLKSSASNSGSSTLTVTYGDGAVAIPSSSVSAGGYVLSGWNTQANGKGKGYAINATFKDITDDLTLYAQWKPAKYNITYNLDGGKVSGNPKTYTVDGVALPVPTKVGYTFNGWTSSNSDCAITYANGVASIAEGSFGNTTLTANWNENQYKIYVHLNNSDLKSGDDWADPITVNFTEKVSVNSLINGLGEKVYEDWELSIPEDKTIMSVSNSADSKASGAKNYEINTTVSALASENNAEVHLYAVWSDKVYTITYDLDGGTISKTVSSYKYNPTGGSIKIPNPTKEGYDFNGWRIVCEATSGDDYIVDAETRQLTIKTGSKEWYDLKATWTPALFNIVINKGDSTEEINAVKYGVGAKDIMANSFSRQGYEFVGLCTDKSGKGKIYTPNASGKLDLSTAGTKTDETVTLYAIWNVATYNITYDENYNEIPITNKSAKKYTYGTLVSLANPTCPGYAFKGWKVDEENSDMEGLNVATNAAGYVTKINKGSYGNVQLEAEWEPFKANITIDLNGAKNSSNKVFKVKTSGVPSTNAIGFAGFADMIYSSVYTKPGYIFTGWSTKASGNPIYDKEEVLDLSTVITKNNANITFYACWEKVATTRVKILNVTINNNNKIMCDYYIAPGTVDHYDIQYSSNKNLRDASIAYGPNVIMLSGTSSATVNYNKDEVYVRIREVKIDSTGKEYYGPWSQVMHASK